MHRNQTSVTQNRVHVCTQYDATTCHVQSQTRPLTILSSHPCICLDHVRRHAPVRACVARHMGCLLGGGWCPYGSSAPSLGLGREHMSKCWASTCTSSYDRPAHLPTPQPESASNLSNRQAGCRQVAGCSWWCAGSAQCAQQRAAATHGTQFSAKRRMAMRRLMGSRGR
jgi:hypothetical protein